MPHKDAAQVKGVLCGFVPPSLKPVLDEDHQRRQEETVQRLEQILKDRRQPG